VRDRVSRVGRLPDQAQPPVSKATDSQPIMILFLRSTANRLN
jgi:multidrug efflux pump subunit AcrB